MDKLKNKNIFVIGFEVLVILISIVGITIATSKLLGNRSNVILNTDEFNVDYIGDNEIVATDLEPISDSLVNINTREKVIRLEFSLRGVSSNKSDNIIYDIMLKDMDIDCSLINEYTKFNLYKNGQLLSHGNFSRSFDRDIIGDSYHLTNIQEDLPSYNSEYDNYVLIIWISESCSDINTCEIIDQSDIIGSKMNMKVMVSLYSGDKKEFERIGSNDSSCANIPDLYDKLIPVRYVDGSFVVASSENTKDNPWYNYGNSEWANAVIVSSDKYNDALVGTVINDEDILGQFVWIPRFKYKTWNILEEITDSYNAYDKGIDIIFEKGNKSTGSVVINDDGVIGNNLDYLTHPAFDGTGFWISKYEMGEDERFVSNNKVLLNVEFDEINDLINNSLGLDSFVINNLEWGAVSYLSHSKYGLCTINGCKNIGNNSEYISGNNSQDSTTRNVYGVYDMSGSGSEYVINNNIKLGTGTDEIYLNENNLWYGAVQVFDNEEYILRGGINSNIYSIVGNGMINKSLRVVIKKTDK